MGRRTTRRRRSILAVFIVVVSLHAMGMSVGVGATAGVGTSGVTEVSECRTIDEPGRYVLTKDIENSGARHCIRIVASNVIFDGQGHTLDARDVDHKTEAVAAGYTNPPIENVTIKNLVVTDWVQGVGCAQVADGVTIRNVTARRNGLTEPPGPENGYGIYVGEFTDNVTVVDNVAANNLNGIVIDETNDTVIRDNIVRDNEHIGIYLGPEAFHNRIVHNQIMNNGGKGILLGGQPHGSNHTVVRANTLRNNTRGIAVERGSSNISIVGNRIVNTSEWGIVLEGRATVADNVIIGGQRRGIAIRLVSGARLRNNTIRSVNGAGIVLEKNTTANHLHNNRIVGARKGLLIRQTAGNTTVHGLVIENSEEQSILLDGTGNNTLTDVRVAGGEGIEIKSPNNRLRNVSLRNTSNYGVRLDGSRNTLLENLQIRDSGRYAIEAVEGTQNLAVINLSLESVRISLRGNEVQVGVVETAPRPPDGLRPTGIAVRLEVRGADPVELTIQVPENATDSGTIELWLYADGWQSLDARRAGPSQTAITGTVSADTEGVVSLLVHPTPTPSPTPILTTKRDSSATSSPLSTPGPTLTPSSEMTPGFGVAVAVLALVTAAYLMRKGKK